MKFSRKKIIFYSFIFLGLIVGGYVFWGRQFYAAYVRYRVLKKERIKFEALVSNLHLEVMNKKYFIKKLMTDPVFREHVAHEQFGVLRKNEYVIRFKDKENVTEGCYGQSF